VGLLQPGDLCGEECLAGYELRVATATALTDCVLIRLERESVVRALHEDRELPELIVSYLAARNIRMQESLVDQLLNPTEKRLARLLLVLASSGEAEGAESIPKISQETLAEMVGTSRTQVNFFMNKFRQLGLIEYNGDITVHRPLLSTLLRDREWPRVRVGKILGNGRDE
jgi:CRP/FNR family cyclic AMP-dependent transcriptional regulator